MKMQQQSTPAACMRPPCRGQAFLRCRRAAATAITAAMTTLMCLAGIAFAGDHIWLVYQRDLLKVAVDAASLAATRHMATLPSSLSDAQVKAALKPLVERYILANLPEAKRDRAADTLMVDPRPNRLAGTVDIEAEADLGGAVFGRWLWGSVTGKTHVASRTERMAGLTEVALAIDVTGSMGEALAEGSPERMAIVKQAALQLVNVLNAGAPAGSVAVGLVPWHFRVQFDQATRTRWEDNGWAQYPTQRYYPNPHWESWKEIRRSSNVGWFPDPHLVTAAGETHTLPRQPEPWQGCVDQRSMSGPNPPGVSTVLPTDEPFTMGFYSATPAYPRDNPISLQCDQKDPIPDRPTNKKDECFIGSGHAGTYKQKDPQFNCGLPTIMPLTTDIEQITTAIESLGAGGSATYSTLGVVWGHRLLAPPWRNTWGDPVHPADPQQNPGTQKALVLLTDGDDNHLDPAIVNAHREQACTAAKAAGIKVFTIAAMDPGRVGDLAQALERCSSQADDPDGTYVFTNNATPEALEDTFREIGRQLVRFRRVM